MTNTDRLSLTFILHVHVYLRSSISLSERNPLQVALQSLLDNVI